MSEEMNGQETYSQPNADGQNPDLKPDADGQNTYSKSNTEEQNSYSQPNADGQNPYLQSNTYNQDSYNYGTGAYYSQPPYTNQPEKPESGVGFGIASLVLGILSLLTFCTVCINIPMAILAIIFAIIQLVRGNGKGLAIGGLITSVVSLIALVVFWIVVGFSMPNMSDIEDWDSYLEEYDSYSDDYNYDYDYDYDDGYTNDNGTF